MLKGWNVCFVLMLEGFKVGMFVCCNVGRLDVGMFLSSSLRLCPHRRLPGGQNGSGLVVRTQPMARYEKDEQSNKHINYLLPEIIRLIAENIELRIYHV